MRDFQTKNYKNGHKRFCIYVHSEDIYMRIFRHREKCPKYQNLKKNPTTANQDTSIPNLSMWVIRANNTGKKVHFIERPG